MELHPWISTPEAVAAARRAVKIPLAMLPGLASAAGADELESEALMILTECATPRQQVRQRESCACCGGDMAGMRRDAKFCGAKCRDQHKKDVARSKASPRVHGAVREPVPAVLQAHIGAMYEWPEDAMTNYAVRTIGYVLNNWLRTGHRTSEIPSDDMSTMPAAQGRGLRTIRRPWAEDPEDAPLDIIAAWLEAHGVRCTGTETLTELEDAVSFVQGRGTQEPRALAA